MLGVVGIHPSCVYDQMREREEFVSAEPMHVNVCVGMWMERSLVNLVKCG